MMVDRLFEDIFQILRLNPDGEKFDKVTRVEAKSETCEMFMHLDVNSECQHNITIVDCQPSGPSGGMLAFVNGNLQLTNEQHALKSSQIETETE
ncbi:hypothetical protein ACFX2J_031766 [Malus domestica]